MPKDAPRPAPDNMVMPQWIYVIALLLGIPLAGGGGSLIGASRSAEDLKSLEVKVDKLDEKLDKLREAIIRAHPDMP